ncbi:MAG: hypothetical protein AB8G96_11410 [Phycisphaerales bacterium]
MVQPTNAWQDRFNTPDVTTLRKGVDTEAAEAFDRIRTDLLRVEGAREVMAWYGQSWGWSIEYHVDAIDDGPLAVIIPAPEDVQMAMTIEPDFLAQLPLRRMKRAIRDGLDLASPPFDTNLAVWSLQPVHILDDLMDLIERRLKFEASRA